MDPNTLSMQQGKDILKQLGIPQRDLDMMQEKWVVVAAVEVMLRFPLQPGEDPTARCVSSQKRQPSQPAQPRTASQTQWHTEDRSGEQQRKSAPQRWPRKPQAKRPSAPKDNSECAYIRKPTRPRAVFASKRPALRPVPTDQPAIHTPTVQSLCPAQSSALDPGLGASRPAGRCRVSSTESVCQAGNTFCQDGVASAKTRGSKPETCSQMPSSCKPSCPFQPYITHPGAHSQLHSDAKVWPATRKSYQVYKVNGIASIKRVSQVPSQMFQNSPKKSRM